MSSQSTTSLISTGADRELKHAIIELSNFHILSIAHVLLLRRATLQRNIACRELAQAL